MCLIYDNRLIKPKRWVQYLIPVSVKNFLKFKHLVTTKNAETFETLQIMAKNTGTSLTIFFASYQLYMECMRQINGKGTVSRHISQKEHALSEKRVGG
ncbi:hypothetical protein Mapa_014243 [Marchantia paleacea]|nr:hypothetical protein Mapa_014243 [Marchantia paleacea]